MTLLDALSMSLEDGLEHNCNILISCFVLSAFCV
jgi:hypothetical protein